MELPLVGLGTWELRGEECTKVVQWALDIGYRHIDTAFYYQNHEAIQKAIKGFDRAKLFITSKIALEQVNPDAVQESVRKACFSALKELGTDYLDLYLIHWPHNIYPMVEIFRAVNELVKDGFILRAGVSNYTINHLEDLRKAGFTPFANQVEFHPYLYQKELLDYSQSKGIQLISYRSLGKGKLLQEEDFFNSIGKKYKKTDSQIILRWLIQKGIAVIPKTTSKKHLQENIEIFDFSLSDEECAQIDRLNQNKRYCDWEDSEFLY